jgi:hypothetical protein
MYLIKEAKRWQKLAGILKEADEDEQAVPDSEIPDEVKPDSDASTPEEPSGTISKDKAKELIKNTKGKFFTVTFTKKDGTTRIMNARLGVKAYLKGGELPYNPEAKGLIPVWDPKAKSGSDSGYRMINVSTINNLKIGNNVYKVQ